MIRWLTPCKALTPSIVYDIASGAMNVPAHVVEHFRQVVDLRLLGGIFNHRRALGQGRRHHEIFRRADRRQIEINFRAAQFRRSRFDITVSLLDGGAQRFEPLEMQIDRARADGTTARRRHPRPAEARHQRADDQERRAHGFDQIIGRFEVVDADRLAR